VANSYEYLSVAWGKIYDCDIAGRHSRSPVDMTTALSIRATDPILGVSFIIIAHGFVIISILLLFLLLKSPLLRYHFDYSFTCSGSVFTVIRRFDMSEVSWTRTLIRARGTDVASVPLDAVPVMVVR
jgi:hypothetical protein